MGVAFGEGGGVYASIVALREKLRIRDAKCVEAGLGVARREGVGGGADFVLELGRGGVGCEVVWFGGGCVTRGIAWLGRGGLTSGVGGLCGGGLVTQLGTQSRHASEPTTSREAIRESREARS